MKLSLVTEKLILFLLYFPPCIHSQESSGSDYALWLPPEEFYTCSELSHAHSDLGSSFTDPVQHSSRLSQHSSSSLSNNGKSPARRSILSGNVKLDLDVSGSEDDFDERDLEEASEKREAEVDNVEAGSDSKASSSSRVEKWPIPGLPFQRYYSRFATSKEKKLAFSGEVFVDEDTDCVYLDLPSLKDAIAARSQCRTGKTHSSRSSARSSRARRRGIIGDVGTVKKNKSRVENERKTDKSTSKEKAVQGISGTTNSVTTSSIYSLITMPSAHKQAKHVQTRLQIA